MSIFQTFKSLHKAFWFNCFSCMCLQNCINGYTIFVTDVLTSRFNYSSEAAGSLLELPYFVVMIFAPVYGIFIDKLGYRLWMTSACCTLIIIAHIIFVVTPDCD